MSASAPGKALPDQMNCEMAPLDIRLKCYPAQAKRHPFPDAVSHGE
jgi:hypothetical protein